MKKILCLLILLVACSKNRGVDIEEFTDIALPSDQMLKVANSGIVNICHEECVTVCEPAPTPEPIPPIPVPSGAVRGVACLHCTLPKARLSAEAVVSTIVRANISRPATNFIVSGTFAQGDEAEEDAYVCDVARRLQGDRPRESAVIELYWQSGPSQRRYASKYFHGIGDQTAPKIWNEQIRTSPVVRAEVLARLQKTAAIARCIVDAGALPFVAALEDNFDSQTFSHVMVLMGQAGFPPQTHFTRNSMAGSYTPGWHMERHGSLSAACKVGGDIWSNDGYSMDGNFFEADAPMDQCDRVGGVGVIHIQKNQGVQTGVPFKPVEERNYHVLNAAEQESLVQLLRNEPPPPPSTGLGAQCPGGILPVQSPILYKEASQHTGDAREGKPAFLVPLRLGIPNSTLIGLNAQGVPVSRMTYYPPPFNNTHHRWYSCARGGTCETGAQLAQEAMPLYLKGGANNICFGPIFDPRIRQGGTQ